MTTATAEPTTDIARGRFEDIPFDRLRESPLNTRKHFDPARLAELQASIAKSGILTPLLVRPNAKLGNGKGPVFEIAAGHRRFRAGQLAEVAAAPCIVREMDDATFLEVLTIENLQREDVHPLEEAQGYKNLLTLDGYDPKKIADRVGKSESHIYDRLKLLQLTAPAKKLFFANRFTIKHAILLARLSKDDQARCLEVANINSYGGGPAGGMWQHERDAHPALGIEDPAGVVDVDGDDDTSRLKPVSVRELQAWIDNHVRFTTPDESTPHLFPETAANLETAAATKTKVVEISRDTQLKEDAKHPDGKRTYCVASWERADGQPEPDRWGEDAGPSKTCDHSVLGVVVAGFGRGDSFEVCIDKKRCTTHWAAAIKERNRREREREKETTGAGKQKAPAKEESWQRDDRLRKEREKRLAQRWEQGRDAVLGAVALKLQKMAMDSTGPVGKWFWERIQDGLYGLSDKGKVATQFGISRGTSAADLMRHAIMCHLVAAAEPSGYSDNEKELQDDLDELKIKVNVTQLVDAANPEPKPEPEPKKKAAAKPAKVKKKAKAKKA